MGNFAYVIIDYQSNLYSGHIDALNAVQALKEAMKKHSLIDGEIRTMGVLLNG